MFASKDLSPRWSRWPAVSAVYEYWDDFDGETTVSTTDTDAFGWAGDAISSGTAVMTVDETGGVLRFANSGTTEDSGYQIQTDMELFSLQASKYTRFAARLRMSDATQSSAYLGLAITDTTLQHATTDTLVAGITFTDGIGFYKPDGELNWYGIVVRDSVQLSVGPLGAGADSTYIVLGFEVQMTETAGTGEVIYYVNGVEKGKLRSTALPYSGEELLAASAAWKSGAAAAQTCDVDYIGVLLER